MTKVKRMSFNHKLDYRDLTTVYEKEAGKVLTSLGVKLDDIPALLPEFTEFIKNKAIVQQMVDETFNIWDKP